MIYVIIIFKIFLTIGNLPTRHKEVFHRNPLFLGMRLPEVRDITPIEKKFTHISDEALNFIKVCKVIFHPFNTYKVPHYAFLESKFLYK